MFGGGGGGLNPRKMKQMMKQMGIDVTEIDAEEVVIRTADEELVFTDADVQRMDAQGQATYQIVGQPETRSRSGGDEAVGADEGADAAVEDAGATDADATVGDADEGAGGIPDSDVEIVAQRTGASEEEAREALREEGGDLAAAVSRLE